MYFWNIKALKESLSNEGLSENESFKYLLATLILFTLASFPFEYSNDMDTLSWLVELGIIAFGTFLCFRANGAAEGKFFLQRYLSLAWVLSVKLIAFLIPFFIVLNIVLEAFGIPYTESTSYIDVVVLAVISSAYYLRLAHHIKTVDVTGA
jgi:hypothetical protein